MHKEDDDWPLELFPRSDACVSNEEKASFRLSILLMIPSEHSVLLYFHSARFLPWEWNVFALLT